MPFCEPLLPSDEWQAAGVHWHAFVEIQDPATTRRRSSRIVRRQEQPHAALWSPWEVARWIDAQARANGDRRRVWSFGDRCWVEIGDEDDLEHLRRENFLIASRGDSIHTDIYADRVHVDLYVEAVTSAQCQHGCTTDQSG